MDAYLIRMQNSRGQYTGFNPEGKTAGFPAPAESAEGESLD
jgi:hypothetical protein